MGFLDNSNIGFGDISVGGGSSGSSGSSQNPDVIFIEESKLLNNTQRCVASKNAPNNIIYTLPHKSNLNDGAMFEFINMNSNYSMTLKDDDDQNIESGETFEVNAQSNISLVLDKENLVWKIIYGI